MEEEKRIFMPAKREESLYSYVLPEDNGEAKTYTTGENSIVIIGANGSGKSKLGAWMEQQDIEGVHRVGAQRSLNFSEHVRLKSFEESEQELFYGKSDVRRWEKNKGARWGYGKGLTTTLLNDYDAVLSTLVAKESNVTQAYFYQCREAELNHATPPRTPETPIDQLKRIWDAVFPQRRIEMLDYCFIAHADTDGMSAKYPATQMSDGERSVLYLAAQVLCVPKSKTIIVDEPEVHLHPSLMHRLWRSLEEMRRDCLFVFITHDIGFAASHDASDKIWVKSFDGESWEWNFVVSSELPDELLMELLGNRRDVLFVEGDRCSYDIRLYSHLYPRYYVVPCGGCSQVIEYTKAFSSMRGLHELNSFGIIDRDYRSNEELEKLKAKGVYSLKVAEVENLFLVEPVLRFLANRFACNDVDSVVSNVKTYIIDQRFAGQMDTQIKNAAIYSLKQKLNSVSVHSSKGQSLAESFAKEVGAISAEEELLTQQGRYKEALDNRDYEEVLKLFNEKGLSGSVGKYFGMEDEQYCSKAIAILDSDDEDELLAALQPYVPELPGSTEERTAKLADSD